MLDKIFFFPLFHSDEDIRNSKVNQFFVSLHSSYDTFEYHFFGVVI
jgi:hypothetical protein